MAEQKRSAIGVALHDEITAEIDLART